MTIHGLDPAAESSRKRDALAALLTRLAALQGEAVPAHRFALLEHTRDGAELATLGAREQALEMWLARFPQAEVRHLAEAALEHNAFPLLWVSDATDEHYLVRGRLSHGALSVEDAAGVTRELAGTEIAAGHLLSLKPDAVAHGPKQLGPRTANDWFAYAIRKHRRIFVEAVFATLVVSVLGLFSSLYTMQVYDRVVPSKGFATLWVLTAGVVIAMLLEFTLKQVRAHMVDRASKAIDLELSGVFFGKALNIRMDARPATVGTFASQIRHFESVRNFMTSSTLFILADAPFAFFFIGVIALIGGPVALVPMIMVPIALISGLFFRGAIERLTEAHMAESNRKNGLLIEAIDGIESVKAAGGEWKMLDRYRDLTATIASSEIELKDINTRAANLAQTIQSVNYVGLIAAGAYAISAGSLTMGGLIACSIIAGRAFSPLAQLPNLVVQWKHAKIALKALDAIMAMPSDRETTDRLVVPESCRGEVRMQQVAFGYLPEKPSLEVVQLTLKPGERVAVLGAVGSGKSTLIKLLSGLFKPKAGQVFLDGVAMDHMAPEFLREHIGYLPQDVRLFNGTLRENLTLGLPTPSDSRLLRACELTGLASSVQAHPKGLELMITEGGRGLSGGQRQLVGLTRLLLAKPRILLLDEPTASMDSQLEARVMKHLFEEMPQESLLVVVTHKIGILPHVNRVIVVDKGRVVLDGPRDEVLAKLQGTSGQRPAAPKVQVVSPVSKTVEGTL
ncbi:type I secretion system permease/ATPase [Candidatus Kaiserbacteria bacterium]|nr:type I secretion system permease/ATPase [Candidatus Kaiserbacteria bacterium]